MLQNVCGIIANETYVYYVPTKRWRNAFNDVDDILLLATASKCFPKLTNVTDDHVHATGRFGPICRQATLLLCWPQALDRIH